MGSEVAIVIPMNAGMPDKKIVVKRTWVEEMKEEEKPMKKKQLTSLLNGDKREWISEVDYGHLGIYADDSFKNLVDELARPFDQPVNIAAEHLIIGWLYLRWAVQISNRPHASPW